MRRPKVAPENHKAVYDFYRDYQPSPLVAKLSYKIIGLADKVNVKFAPGIKERIVHAAHDPNERLILSANHVSNRDTLTLAKFAGMPEGGLPVDVVGRAKIPAKDDTTTFRLPVVRHLIDAGGGFPVFRKQQFDKLTHLSAEEREGLYQQTLDEYINLSAWYIEDDFIFGNFPEGKRNKTGRPWEVQPIRPGLGWILERVDPALDIVTVPIAIRHIGRRASELYVGQPLVGSEVDPATIGSVLHTRLQETVNLLHSERQDLPLAA